MHDFEFDANKSLKNKKKHGIDFNEAQELWKDIDLFEIRAKTVDEKRYVIIGKIGTTYWTGIITYRGEKIRIISIRPSRVEEKELYESK